MNRFQRNSSFIKYNTRRKWSIFSKIPLLNKINFNKDFKYYAFYFWLGLFLLFFLCFVVIYVKYILPLPAVSELWKLNFANSSIIYDRNWNELYKIYKENRTYVDYESISKNIVNALVAWEDKTFFQNSWVDFKRMIWAVVYYLLWKRDKVEWTSTISQQLIRNTLIWSERNLERKVKEMYLSYKLSYSLSKEKVIELYLNKIEFGSNAFGIEQASKTFFWISAKDLSVLQWSILASLPKWPSYYSPINHPDRLLWYLYVYDEDNVDNPTKVLTSKEKIANANEISEFNKYIDSLKSKNISDSTTLICWINKKNHKKTLTIDKDWCSVVDYSNLLGFLNSIKIEINKKFVEYQAWRKDFVLQRMLEDKYISFEDYKKSIETSIWYKFDKNKDLVKSPHFVFYLKEYLETKYWKEIVEKWWLKIYTTLDANLQKKAEDLVTKYAESNAKKYDANNAALVSLDNKTWDILAMIWWSNYFDIDNWWNVNILTSHLQPGSSFKPFVYAMAIDNNTVWSKTPIFDLKTTFPWKYTPDNFDWRFNWLMNVSTALDNSRNIPAIKMVYIWWWEKMLVNFVKKLWIESIKSDWSYWASIWLWTAEITPLEMATAYSVFANLWEKKEVSPIMKILDSKWVTIEERVSKKWEQVLDSATAYIINSILSDTSSRPPWWNAFISLPDRKVAAKTWTSTKQYTEKWKKIKLPRNLWTIWYTPQLTTVVWAWNTDWSPTNMKWDWLNVAGPIWRDFMKYAHYKKTAEEWKMPSWVKIVNISKLTWFIPDAWTSSSLIVSSMFKNVPKKVWTWLKTVKIDALCNWKVSELTPQAWIKDVYMLDIASISSANVSWNWPIESWIKAGWYKEIIWDEMSDLNPVIKDSICDRWETWNEDIKVASKINIWDKLKTGINYIELAYRSITPIIRIDFLLDWKLIYKVPVVMKKEWVYKWNFIIPSNYFWEYDLVIRVVDEWFYSSEETKNINIIKDPNYKDNILVNWEVVDIDKVSPVLIIKNPIDKSIKLYNWQEFNLRWEATDNMWLKSVNIYMDWKSIKVWLTESSFVYPISWTWLEIWDHIIKVEAVDESWNITSDEVKLEVIE